MRVLITGANGYIGSMLVKYFLNKDDEVIATDIDNKNVDKRAYFTYADILDEKENWYAFFKEPDLCIHLAWRDGFVHDSDKHILDLSSHFKFLKNMIDNGLKNLSVMGTMHEVGYYNGKVNRDTPCRPLNLYGISKVCLRESLLKYAKEKNVSFKWLRTYYILGNEKNGRNIFSKIYAAYLKGEKSFPINSGLNEYDFININDLVRYIYFCSKQINIDGVIEICSGKPVSLKEKLNEFLKENSISIKLEFGKYPDREYDSKIIYGDKAILEKVMESQHL